MTRVRVCNKIMKQGGTGYMKLCIYAQKPILITFLLSWQGLIVLQLFYSSRFCGGREPNKPPEDSISSYGSPSFCYMWASVIRTQHQCQWNEKEHLGEWNNESISRRRGKHSQCSPTTVGCSLRRFVKWQYSSRFYLFRSLFQRTLGKDSREFLSFYATCRSPSKEIDAHSDFLQHVLDDVSRTCRGKIYALVIYKESSNRSLSRRLWGVVLASWNLRFNLEVNIALG